MLVKRATLDENPLLLLLLSVSQVDDNDNESATVASLRRVYECALAHESSHARARAKFYGEA